MNFCLYATAMETLVDWPNGFHKLFCFFWQQLGNGRPLEECFPTIYPGYLEKQWNYEQFSFVQDEFEKFILRHFKQPVSTVRFQKYQSRNKYRLRFRYMT